MTTTTKTHLKSIQEIVKKDLVQFRGCEILASQDSKNLVYKLEDKDGEPLAKVRVVPFIPPSFEIHAHLIKKTSLAPKTIKVTPLNGLVYKFTEWIEGTSLNKLSDSNAFEDLEDFVVYQWGECMGLMNNIVVEGKRISIGDVWWHNFILTSDKGVVCCDMSKLHLVLYPEVDIMKWIVFNAGMPLKTKDLFLSGYFESRDFVSLDVRESVSLFHKKMTGEKHVNA